MFAVDFAGNYKLPGILKSKLRAFVRRTARLSLVFPKVHGTPDKRLGTDLDDRLTIAVNNGIWDGCSATFLPSQTQQRMPQNTTVPAPVGSLSLHTHAGCVSVVDRENRAPVVEFRDHLADADTAAWRHSYSLFLNQSRKSSIPIL